MSRATRLSLAALALVVLLAPPAAFHPVVSHLYAAGLSSIWAEASHVGLLGLFLIALFSLIPAVGFFASLVHAVRGRRHLQSLMQNSNAASVGDLDYRLLPSSEVVVFTAGIFRPVTFVSSAAQQSLSEAELRAALLHEQAHQRSRDVLWKLILRAVRRSFPFIPLVRNAVDAETLRAECRADEYALEEGAKRRELFEAIVTASSRPPGRVSVGLTDADVELRLARLVEPATPLPRAPTRSFMVLSAVATLPAVLVHLVAVAATLCSSSLAS